MKFSFSAVVVLSRIAICVILATCFFDRSGIVRPSKEIKKEIQFKKKKKRKLDYDLFTFKRLVTLANMNTAVFIVKKQDVSC